MIHPTPVEIEIAIHEAIIAHNEIHYDTPAQRIPVEMGSLVRGAIKVACDRKDAENGLG